MFLFMLILLPAVLVYCCIRSSDKAVTGVVSTGAIAGVLVSGCTALFTYLHRVPEFSFVMNTLYYLLKEYFLPVVLLYLVFFLLTKDDTDFKVKAFFPLLTGFYAVYMPYRIIASTSGAFSFFQLFAKPVLVLAMLIFVSEMILLFYKGIISRNVKLQVLSVPGVIAAILIPAVIDGIYIAFNLPVLVYTVSAVYAAGACVVFFLQIKKEDGFLL